MKAKKWFFQFLLILFFLLVLFASITILVDPYFHYHKPFLSYRLYEERYINDGISRHFDFDTMITGSSMTQNFKTSELDAIFGTKSVKESFSGSGYREQADNIARAIKHNAKLKTVIWGLDYNGLLRDANWQRYDEYPTYLYDNNVFNDVSYLLNKSIMYHGTLVNLFMTFTGQDSTSFDEYSYWDDIYADSNFTDPDTIEPMKPELSATSRASVCNTIQQNIIPVVKQNPNVEFYLFLTPYSISYWDSTFALGDTIEQIEAEQQAIELLLPYPNVHLFSFTEDHETINNLGNYHDSEHYNAKVNSLILKYMADEKYMLTKDNYKQHIQNTKDYYLNFDYESIDYDFE